MSRPISVVCFILLLSALFSVPVPAETLKLEWRDLLPEQLNRTGSVPPHQQVRRDLNQKDVRIPGYIVPLDYDGERAVTRFLLVPYFGACIHEPPPPPNQTIYAEFEPGIELDSIWYPHWIEGRVTVGQVDAEFATASYTIDAVKVEQYEGP